VIGYSTTGLGASWLIVTVARRFGVFLSLKKITPALSEAWLWDARRWDYLGVGVSFFELCEAGYSLGFGVTIIIYDWSSISLIFDDRRVLFGGGVTRAFGLDSPTRLIS
jgi:hypothetical protein